MRSGRRRFLITSVLVLPLAACRRADSVPDNNSVVTSQKAARVSGTPSDTLVTDRSQTTFAEPTEPVIVGFRQIGDLPEELAIFDSVFWEPDDTTSLRQLIRETDLVREKKVLEVGTGSGLLSLCCLHAGATHVVATDINPQAVACAQDNALRLGVSGRIECRLVPKRNASAWSVVRADERFDVIISNPPWEDRRPATVSEFALYDPGFALLDSLLQGAVAHLQPGGQLLLAYGCVTALRRILSTAARHGLTARILDDRNLDELPEVFLPGMLVGLRAT